MIAQIIKGITNQQPKMKSIVAMKGSSIISQTNQLTKHIGMRLMYLLMISVNCSKVGLTFPILLDIVK